MTTIKILGIGDQKTKALRDNVQSALSQYPIQNKIIEVSEVNLIAASGISRTPALLFDNIVVCEGAVPTVEEIARLLRNRMLYRSKLYRLNKILVPVDFSAGSENAFLYAWHLAKRFGATIDLVHVMDSMFDGGMASASGFMSSYLRTMKTELDAFATESFRKWGLNDPAWNQGMPGDTDTVRVRSKVVFGYPEESLENLSGKFDLIVMGATGKGHIAANLFGSVSVELSQRAHCPVLLVPQNAVFMDFSNILYGSNFESNDPEKVRQIVFFAKKINAQLHFVHVGPPKESGEMLEKTLFEIHYKYSDPDKPFIFQKMVGDDLSEKLHEYAFEHKIGLFVFVTHRRGLWGNLMHRSATKEILLNTTTPLLVVHQFNDVVNN